MFCGPYSSHCYLWEDIGRGERANADAKNVRVDTRFYLLVSSEPRLFETVALYFDTRRFISMNAGPQDILVTSFLKYLLLHAPNVPSYMYHIFSRKGRNTKFASAVLNPTR